MKLDAKQVAKELAEEIRTNSKLRHRLGMVEGSQSGPLSEDHPEILAFDTAEGETFFIQVEG